MPRSFAAQLPSPRVPLRGLPLLALAMLLQAPWAEGKKPQPGGASAANGMLMPDLGKVLGPGWTVPPELSDRAAPGVVLEVSAAGYKRVMAGCVAAQPNESSVTDVSLSNSLSGGVGWGGGALSVSAMASSALKLKFNGPTVHAYDLVEFAPSQDCVVKLQALAARGGSDPSRWVVVQEALMARVSGCEDTAAGAGLAVPGGGAGVSSTGSCQMFSDAPVAVGVKTVALADIPELSGLVASTAPAPAPEPRASSAPAPAPRAPEPSAAAGSRSVGSSGYALRLVPAGTYTIGCTAGQGSDCEADEKPARRVTLSRAILVGETEVTQGLYQRLMGDNPSEFRSCGATCPVELVSWLEAVAFANKLSASEGLETCYVISGERVTWPKGASCLGYRLPTEAEWEVAARGGRDDKYSGGGELGAVGWYDGNSGDGPHPVGQKAANGYGLYDMSGNVWEWAWDWYDSSTNAGGAVTDPVGPASGSSRVFRGGCWFNDPQFARVAIRFYDTPGSRSSLLGIRLLRTAG